jgi:hypothetical protein
MVVLGTSPVLEIAPKTDTAVAVRWVGEEILAVNPKRVVAAVVVLTGPENWSRAVLNTASVGMTDEFINRCVIIAPVLSIGGIFVPCMEPINDGLPNLQVSGFDAPKIAYSKYATRDPAVRPIL